MIEGAPPELVEEVWGDCYRAVPHFNGGLVIDIGAGVGTFSAFARRHGCPVLAVEPDPKSAKLWHQNVDAGGMLIERPVGNGGFVEHREAGHGWQTFPGLDEPTLVWSSIAQPCDVLKVDCEGAEYPFLIGVDLTMVAYIAVEFHVWTDEPNDRGLGVRPEPMPAQPEDLLARLDYTHDIEVVGDLETGGLMLGVRR